MKRTPVLALSVVSFGLVVGCHREDNSPPPQQQSTSAKLKSAAPAKPMATEADAAKEAVAHIHGAGDSRDKIHGTATFMQEAGGLKIVVDVDGLTPGKHGIHIHEKPDMSDPKLMSTGGHYNPDDADHHHAGPEDAKRHAGDLGNIEVDANGHGHLEMTDNDLSVSGKNAVVGHSLIIHEKEDDLKSQPAGNAGGRIAGGVIVLAADHEKSGG